MITSRISSINGILLLNKPKHISSNAALQRVKRLYGIKKAGHSGSLDPIATGMLPICLGEATKVCQYLLRTDKCYETTGILGIKTDTSDAMGAVIATVTDYCISLDQITAVLNQFKGCSTQIPSMYSALKHKGKALYYYARKGIEIERQPRTIVIHSLKLNYFDGQHFALSVCCSKGTYIRNLVEDIGMALGVGAHVSCLHRVYTAGFENLPMYCLDELEDMSLAQRIGCLLPMDKAIEDLKPIILTEEETLILRQGRILKQKMDFEKIESVDNCSTNPTKSMLCGLSAQSLDLRDKRREVEVGLNCQQTLESVRLYDCKLGFIGLGQSQKDGGIKAKRLLSF